MLLNLMKLLLSTKNKERLATNFPKLYAPYERYYILNELNLRKYYNKFDDSLHFQKTVLPMKILCDVKLMGVFNTEYVDIIYPMLPSSRIKQAKIIIKHSYLEGPYLLDNVTVSKGDVVFDCGANLGLFSAMLANYDCTCWAFEPLPANISYLKKIIRVNPHIKLAPYAVSDTDGIIKFTNSSDFSTANKIASNKKLTKNTISADAISIDSFVAKKNIKKVDFIKADIEGAERLLLKGAKEVLKEFAPKLSICKYHLPDDPQVLRQLILDANPKYVIEERWMKIYAHVPVR